MRDNQSQDTAAQKNRIQSELIILESDYKKNEREKGELVMEIRRLKKEKTQIEIYLEEKEQGIKKLESEQAMVEGEMKNLKKKLNLL